MRERPIIMSAPMVRAILAGTKTQARRVVKLPANARDVQYYAPPGGVPLAGWADPGINYWTHDGDRFDDDTGMPVLTNHIDPCPYGVPGDRLWVRETWLELDRDGYVEMDQPRDVLTTRHGYPRRNGVAYRAECDADGESARAELGYKWRSPIHMPRWASRITLEITGVRVERLNDISEADAMAEGASPVLVPPDGGDQPHVVGYRDLWESINGAGSWDANPWVWVVAFRRVA